MNECTDGYHKLIRQARQYELMIPLSWSEQPPRHIMSSMSMTYSSESNDHEDDMFGSCALAACLMILIACMSVHDEISAMNWKIYAYHVLWVLY